MGDVGDTFNELKEISKAKRESNRNSSAKYLADRGISYESKNLGAHLIVKESKSVIDFWPGTGKWIARDGKKGYGVKNLVAYLEK